MSNERNYYDKTEAPTPRLRTTMSAPHYCGPVNYEPPLPTPTIEQQLARLRALRGAFHETAAQIASLADRLVGTQPEASLQSEPKTNPGSVLEELREIADDLDRQHAQIMAAYSRISSRL